MRTTVYTNGGDLDETDEWPDCGGSTDEDGSLIICDSSMGVEAAYAPGEWHSFETVAN